MLLLMNGVEKMNLELVECLTSNYMYKVMEGRYEYLVDVHFENGEFNGVILQKHEPYDWEEVTDPTDYDYIKKVAIADYNA